MSASCTAIRRWSAQAQATRRAHRPRSTRTSTSAWASACRSTTNTGSAAWGGRMVQTAGGGAQGSVAGFTGYIQQIPAAIGLSTDSGHGTADSGSGDAWGVVQGCGRTTARSRTGAAVARIAPPSCWRSRWPARITVPPHTMPRRSTPTGKASPVVATWGTPSSSIARRSTTVTTSARRRGIGSNSARRTRGRRW
jgi:hypothetical protein